jgi:hypothetical protein
VLLPALGFALALRPYLTVVAAQSDRLVRERDLLGREAALLAEARSFEARYAEIERATLGQAPRLFAGSDPLAASADLANYVAGRAMAHRVMVQQSETGEPEPQDGLARLRVELRAVSDLEGIAGLLHALERGPKLARVEQLLLVPVASAPPASEDALSLTATVVGYALADSAEAAESLGVLP